MAIVERALLVLVLVLSLLLGWNWWRKNVYYDALHVVAAERVQAARVAENTLRTKLTALDIDWQNRSKMREQTLEAQLADAARNPAERVVYKLRDRWLPVSCPAGATGVDRPEEVGGLQREDEQFLVRESHRADANTDQLNACIDAYELVRQAALKAQR
jgi:hypothetical protein